MYPPTSRFFFSAKVTETHSLVELEMEHWRKTKIELVYCPCYFNRKLQRYMCLLLSPKLNYFNTTFSNYFIILGNKSDCLPYLSNLIFIATLVFSVLLKLSEGFTELLHFRLKI